MKKKIMSVTLAGLLSLTFAVSSALAAGDQVVSTGVTGNNFSSTAIIDGQGKNGRLTLKISGDAYGITSLSEKCSKSWVSKGLLNTNSVTNGGVVTANFYLKSGCQYKADLYGTGDGQATVWLYNYNGPLSP
ncbi:hypothetical protein [Paenibacillus lutrae]|uniref:Uncharacterized protein n=1 Tax=Paenibacillus lutrae TaxID=2078573 RepID=A0A7X3K0U6_9BACL|nr:hypothetical protein [Paenibacillus lutrae]MVP01450.1 hypothetical protein [Paenibacillus lutrae]